MRTPLELALEQLCGAHPSYAQLSPSASLKLWLKLFAPTFFGLMLCCLIAIGCALLLLNRGHSHELRPLLSFSGLLLLSLSYGLGNILLLQGIAGARLVYGLLLSALLALIIASLHWHSVSGLFFCGLATCLGAAMICLSPRFRALQTLHQHIRRLRLEQGPKRL